MPDFHNLTITGVEQEPNEAIHVTFNVPDKLTDTFEFKQGQHVTLKADIEGEEVRRSYSICAGTGEPLSIAIKRIEDGAFSTYAHACFVQGMTIPVMPPDGSFYTDIEPTSSRKYLLIAAGSGITPIISIAKTVLAEEPNSQVTLLYGNRRSKDIIFKERLLWLKNRYMTRLQWINFLSQESQEAPILNGRLDSKKRAELNQHLIDITSYDEFFLCGPEGLISEVSKDLRTSGIEEAHIHRERFFASAEDALIARQRSQKRADQYAGLTTEVRVRSGGREISFELNADGENILDGAIRAGLELPFSCKGGVCATCKARITEGEVDMDLHHALSANEVNDGFILTCQSHPISKRVCVDFDVI